MSMGKSKSGAILRLQEWYSSQCDGDWEHSYGVKIDTLDNPGWILTIDLVETSLDGISFERERIVKSEADWIQYEITDNKFIACGGGFEP